MRRRRWTPSSTTAAAGRPVDQNSPTTALSLKCLSDMLKGAKQGPLPLGKTAFGLFRAVSGYRRRPGSERCTSAVCPRSMGAGADSEALRRKGILWKRALRQQHQIRPQMVERTRTEVWGFAGSRHRGPSRYAQPRADAAPPWHPGVRRGWWKAAPSSCIRWSALRSTRTFDGDQMAVHVPLPEEAQREAKRPDAGFRQPCSEY